jgi:hypothetical protein
MVLAKGTSTPRIRNEYDREGPTGYPQLGLNVRQPGKGVSQVHFMQYRGVRYLSAFGDLSEANVQ